MLAISTGEALAAPRLMPRSMTVLVSGNGPQRHSGWDRRGPIAMVLAIPPYIVDEDDVSIATAVEARTSCPFGIVEQGLARLGTRQAPFIVCAGHAHHCRSRVDPFDSVRPLLQLHVASNSLWNDTTSSAENSFACVPPGRYDRPPSASPSSSKRIISSPTQIWSETAINSTVPPSTDFTPISPMQQQATGAGIPQRGLARRRGRGCTSGDLLPGQLYRGRAGRDRAAGSQHASGVDDFIDWFEELNAADPGRAVRCFRGWRTTRLATRCCGFCGRSLREAAGPAGRHADRDAGHGQAGNSAEVVGGRDGPRPGAVPWPLLERLADYLRSRCRRRTRSIPERLRWAMPCWRSPEPPATASSRSSALSMIEMTAPARAGFVDADLKRLGIPTKRRVLHLARRSGYRTFRVLESPRCFGRWFEMARVSAAAIGEGAIIRLARRALTGRYRRHFSSKFSTEAQRRQSQAIQPDALFLRIGDAADTLGASLSPCGGGA